MIQLIFEEDNHHHHFHHHNHHHQYHHPANLWRGTSVLVNLLQCSKKIWAWPPFILFVYVFVCLFHFCLFVSLLVCSIFVGDHHDDGTLIWIDEMIFMMMMMGLMYLNMMRKMFSKKRWAKQQKLSETALPASFALDYYDFDSTKVGHNVGRAIIPWCTALEMKYNFPPVWKPNFVENNKNYSVPTTASLVAV